MKPWHLAWLPAVVLAVVSTRAHQQKPVCPLGSGWTFVADFSDEFEGDTLDQDKWWDFNPTTFIGRKPGLFSRDTVAVKEAFGTSASPGIGPRTSSSGAPQRRCQRR